MSVCEKVIEAAVSLVCPDELSLETILHFIAALPREFIDSGGKKVLLICSFCDLYIQPFPSILRALG